MSSAAPPSDARTARPARRLRRSPADTTSLVGAEIGLLALALGTAAGFIRLFDSWQFLGRLLVPLLVAWGLALGLRRLGWSMPVSALAQAATGVVVLGWWFAPDTLAVVLPTGATASALGDAVSDAFGRFDQLVAPVVPDDGFLVIVAVVLWVFAGFADAAAFRYRAPVQAAIPYAAAFVAVGVLAREPGRTAAAVWFLFGLGAYAVGQRALSGATERWVRGRERSGVRSLAAGAALLAIGATVVGLAVGPRLPGSTEPVVDLRELGRGDGPRTVVSPFVGIRSLLGERSDEVMFRVEADEAAYWRLTSLEEYDPDREIWVSRGTYRRVDGTLPETLAPRARTRPLVQRFQIDALSGVWLPAAYAPSSISGDVEVSYATGSASIILRSEDASGLAYEVRSDVPVLDELPRSARAADDGGDLDEQYLDVAPLAPEVVATFAAVVADATDDEERLLRLQNWFREQFSYDETVDYTGAGDAVAAFLEQRRGFCQQFASTFALAARWLGIPARVAVGFTPGEALAGEDGTGTTYVVRGRYAHAWPEVHLAGVGWVPFEPTPQRGNPQAQGYTGVPPQQAADTPVPETTTTTAPTTTTAADTAPPTTSPDDLSATGAPEAPEQAADPGPSPASRTAVVTLVAVAVLLASLVAARRVARRRRRARHQRHVDEAVADAWTDALRALAALGHPTRPDETPLEFSRRVLAVEPDLPIDGLARVETRRRFAPGGVDRADGELAEQSARTIAELVRERTTRRDRLAASVSR